MFDLYSFAWPSKKQNLALGNTLRTRFMLHYADHRNGHLEVKSRQLAIRDRRQEEETRYSNLNPCIVAESWLSEGRSKELVSIGHRIVDNRTLVPRRLRRPGDLLPRDATSSPYRASMVNRAGCRAPFLCPPFVTNDNSLGLAYLMAVVPGLPGTCGPVESTPRVLNVWNYPRLRILSGLSFGTWFDSKSLLLSRMFVCSCEEKIRSLWQRRT